jgi:hypothetical protein
MCKSSILVVEQPSKSNLLSFLPVSTIIEVSSIFASTTFGDTITYDLNLTAADAAEQLAAASMDDDLLLGASVIISASFDIDAGG